MDRRKAIDILSGRRRGAGVTALRAGLALAAVPYAGAMKLRRWMYRRGLLRRTGVSVPVICVGNITCGGTGKTPMVAWVVRQLRRAGHRPAVLPRGYRSVVGRSDEAELLKRLTGAKVVVEPDRVAAAQAAISDGADVLVMDDGFQHRRLRRDLDIVLIDATDPFGGRCLPAGLRREPLSALRDADAVVITRCNEIDKDRLEKLKTRLSRLSPEATIHAAVHKPLALIDEAGGELPLREIDGRRVLAFCGIGNPESFFAAVGRLGANIVARRALDDHVDYTPAIIDSLNRAAAEARADFLVTTQKDFVKLQDARFDRPVWQLAVEMKIVEGPRALAEAVLEAVR
ncbi:MAG: tetraacyldisaccharide 4'-kinase [Planctomycetota bacterium]|jgi:tetraacyldisaccharide 4'-kinase